LIIFTRQFWYF